jgi:hypothetical protein
MNYNEDITIEEFNSTKNIRKGLLFQSKGNLTDIFIVLEIVSPKTVKFRSFAQIHSDRRTFYRNKVDNGNYKIELVDSEYEFFIDISNLITTTYTKKLNRTNILKRIEKIK